MQSKIIQEIRDDYSPEKNTERTLRGYATSIKTLAEDLYAKDTHFIFELIQNAEDNIYEVDTPSLRFVLTKADPVVGKNGKTVLIVENNEVGFQKENVEAICSVGRSTKIKDQGYIGEKGIGFKSVFRVTSCPHIFSRGFRFSLPEKDDFSGLGYIVPTWLPAVPENLDDKITSIYLPLDKSDFPVNKVSQSLKDIAPETIIFLKKLKTIELVVNLAKQYEIIIEKDDSEFPLVKLTYLKRDGREEKIKEQLFWVTTKEFIKPPEITHEKRQKIDSRDVSIAIPILRKNKEKGKLFAYLPVWDNTGLPFLINADFLLTSSREAVKEDELWNGWLRSCVAEVYVEALTSCLSENSLTFEQKISSYASLPRRTNQKFLQPIIPAIQEQLEKTLCIYTAQCDMLAVPHTTRIAPKEFWDLLSEDNFPSALQKHVQLVCQKLEPYNKRLIDIGASHLTQEDIIECLDDSNWLENKSNEWFVQLYRYLKKYNIEDESLATKRIIKTWSDTELKTYLSCSDDQPIYFERDDESRTIIKDVPDWLQKIVPVSFLNREFWEHLSAQEDNAELTEWMTEHLQVHPFSKTNFCIDILNVLQEKYESLSPKRIAAVTAFLTTHTDEEFDEWDSLPVVFNTGEKAILYEFEIDSKNIVVPERYDRGAGWQHLWINDNDRQHFSVLSNHYRPETVDHLLSYCGDYIKKYPPPERVVKITYDAVNDYERKCLHEAPYSTGQKTISNWRPPSSLQSETVANKLTSDSLVSFLSQADWQHFKSAMVNYFYYSSKISWLDSEFFSRVKTCKWVPTQKGFVRPEQSFLPIEEIKEILGEAVPYFQERLPIEAIKALGIKEKLTLEELLKTITAYSSETNVNHEMVYRLYSAIDTRTRFGSAAGNVIQLFKKQKLIFVPTENDHGQWYALENVIWEDSEKTLGTDFIYLQKYYPKLKDFFINTLGVKEKADPESFAQRWLRIQEDAKTTPQEKREYMDPIYRVLLPIAKMKANDRPDWWNGFVEEALFLTQQGDFVDTDELVVPDDGELKRIFSDTDIRFVWRPEKDSFNQWAPFYEAFGIPRISESVQGVLAEESDFVTADCNGLVTPSMIAMLASWLREKDDRHYNALLEDGMFHKLRDICEAETDKEIKIVFMMEAGYLYEEVEASYPVFWNLDKGILIIDRSAGLSSIKRKVSVEIAKGLMSNRAYKDLANWIELILGAEDTDRIQDYGWPVPRDISKLLKKDSGSFEEDFQEKESENKKTDRDGTKPEDNDTQSHGNKRASNEQKAYDNSHDNTGKAQNDVNEQQKDPAQNQGENKKQSTRPPGGESQSDKSEDFESEDNADNIADNEDLSETIIEQFNKAFDRDGETTLSEEFDDDEFYNPGNVKNPDRHREKSRTRNKSRITDEPNSNQRRRETISNILEPADPATREYLLNLYSGKCQICKETFPQRNGTPFFVASHIVDRKHARLLDNPANALCLCPLHFAQWRHGAVKAADVLEQIRSKKTKAEGGEKNIALQIELCGKKCEISYKEKHIVELQALLAEVMSFTNEES